MTTITIDIDFNGEFPQAMMDILYMAEDNGGKIVHFKAHGPGGGNPNAVIDMPNYESAMVVMTKYFDGDAEEAAEYLAV